MSANPALKKYLVECYWQTISRFPLPGEY